MTAAIALVTAREALALDEDMPPLVSALRARGASVQTPFWDDPSVDWSHFDVAVLRSTWDYVDRIDEFLAWADRSRCATHLLNSPEVVRWNTDKHYLAHLECHGVPPVPTRFVEPGADVDAEFGAFLAGRRRDRPVSARRLRSRTSSSSLRSARARATRRGIGASMRAPRSRTCAAGRGGTAQYDVAAVPRRR